MCRPSFAIDREWFRFGRDRHDSRQFKSGIGAGIVVARDLNIDRNMQWRGKSLDRCPCPVRHQQIALISDVFPAPLKPRNSVASREKSSVRATGSLPASSQ